MATVISYTSGSGTHRRCDATCHEAKKSGCVCICGGRLHGCGGSDQAIERNTEDWLGKEWQSKHLTPDQITSALKAAMGAAVAALKLEPTGRCKVAIPQARPVTFRQAAATEDDRVKRALNGIDQGLAEAHVHDRQCWEDPGPSHGRPFLICEKLGRLL